MHSPRRRPAPLLPRLWRLKHGPGRAEMDKGASSSHIGAMDTIDRDDTRTKPAAKPRDDKRPLRAKPTEGAVDHEALSREFMARFPKLRAALAK